MNHSGQQLGMCSDVGECRRRRLEQQPRRDALTCESEATAWMPKQNACGCPVARRPGRRQMNRHAQIVLNISGQSRVTNRIHRCFVAAAPDAPTRVMLPRGNYAMWRFAAVSPRDVSGCSGFVGELACVRLVTVSDWPACIGSSDSARCVPANEALCCAVWDHCARCMGLSVSEAPSELTATDSEPHVSS